MPVYPPPLSEKAKGKQRAVEPPLAADQPAPRPPLPEATSRDLVVRFTEGAPDLTIRLHRTDSVREVKKHVRAAAGLLPMSTYSRCVLPVRCRFVQRVRHCRPAACGSSTLGACSPTARSSSRGSRRSRSASSARRRLKRALHVVLELVGRRCQRQRPWRRRGRRGSTARWGP